MKCILSCFTNYKIFAKAGIISLLNDMSPAHNKTPTFIATIPESLPFL